MYNQDTGPQANYHKVSNFLREASTTETYKQLYLDIETFINTFVLDKFDIVYNEHGGEFKHRVEIKAKLKFMNFEH
jgi:hypothetical protein